MNPIRAATITVLGLRIAYGAALLAAPERLTARWLGDDAERAGTEVALRGLGAREVIFHAGALTASLRGAACHGSRRWRPRLWPGARRP